MQGLTGGALTPDSAKGECHRPPSASPREEKVRLETLKVKIPGTKLRLVGDHRGSFFSLSILVGFSLLFYLSRSSSSFVFFVSCEMLLRVVMVLLIIFLS